MAIYVLRRILLLIPVLLGISFLVFLGLRLTPGDPVMTMLAESNTAATADLIASLRHQLGLDLPWPVQFARFVWHALHGDLGRSWRTDEAVLPMVLQQFPSTLELAFAGLAFAIAVGTILGVIAAVNRNGVFDSLTMAFATVGVSMPSFWLGLLLIYMFAVRLGWVSITGFDDLPHLVLPALTLGIQSAAVYARLVRSGMLEVLRSEYILTARAKGLTERVVIWSHALNNALIPVVTIAGLQFGGLLGGAVVVEMVFGRQGIGRLAVAAITTKDYPVVQGVVLLTATAYVLVNLAVDLLYALLDPRIRYG